MVKIMQDSHLGLRSKLGQRNLTSALELLTLLNQVRQIESRETQVAARINESKYRTAH